jgi:hypothetical protein
MISILVELLTGLLIATMLVVGWACGSIFACVFLTLPVALVALLCAVQDSGPRIGSVLICLAIIAVIWTPAKLRKKI